MRFLVHSLLLPGHKRPHGRDFASCLHDYTNCAPDISIAFFVSLLYDACQYVRGLDVSVVYTCYMPACMQHARWYLE